MIYDPVEIRFGSEVISVSSVVLDQAGLVKGFDAKGKMVVCLDPARVGEIRVGQPQPDWRELLVFLLNEAGGEVSPNASATTLKKTSRRLVAEAKRNAA